MARRLLTLGAALGCAFVAGICGEKALEGIPATPVPSPRMAPLCFARHAVIDVVNLHMSAMRRQGDLGGFLSDAELLLEIAPHRDTFSEFLMYDFTTGLTKQEPDPARRRLWIRAALEVYRRGLELNPRSAALHHGYAMAGFLSDPDFVEWLLRTDGVDLREDMLEHFETAVALDAQPLFVQNFAYALMLGGYEFLEGGDPRSAHGLFARAIELESEITFLAPWLRRLCVAAVRAVETPPGTPERQRALMDCRLLLEELRGAEAPDEGAFQLPDIGWLFKE